MVLKGRIIKSTNIRTMILLIVAAFLWNIITLSIIEMLAKDIGLKNNIVPIIASVLLLVGLILVIFAGRSIMRQIKFRNSVLILKGNNAVIGEILEGTVDTSINIMPEDGFDLKLTCIYRYVTGIGKTRKTHKKTLVEIRKKVEREFLFKDDTRSSIPINLEIPLIGSKESCGNWFSNDSVIWVLEVKAKVPGLDYFAAFEVPVKQSYASLFEAEEMQKIARESLSERKLVDENPEVEEVVPESLTAKEAFYQKLEAAGIKVEQAAKTEKVFSFSAFRTPGCSLILALVTLVVAGLAIFFFVTKDSPSSFAVTLSVFAMIMLIVFIKVSFFRSTVTITLHTLILESGSLFKGSREFDFKEINSIFVENPMQVNGKSYYVICMDLNSGKKVKLATRISDMEIAERLASEMNKLVSEGHKK